nr:retrovirus-related Pol polyprotein from transposon TNT 1-94 [Tanacetum cinerariifolium]
MVDGQRKPKGQRTRDERKAANLDQRLKSLIMSVLSDDQMNSIINCLTAKSTWDDLILYRVGPSDVKESSIMDLKLCYNTFKFKKGEALTQTFTIYKALMNELVNDVIKLSKLEINTGFINELPKMWLSFYQSLRNTNHVKDSELASLFDSLDDEEDTRSNHEYLNVGLSIATVRPDRTGKPDRPGRPDWTECISVQSSHKPELRPTKDFEDKYNKVKAKLALLSLSASASKAAKVKNKGLIAETYEWNEEYVSLDDNEMVEVKVLMALAEDNDAISKKGARNGKWVKISMRKVLRAVSLPTKCAKSDKALYGLKQAPIAWPLDEPTFKRLIVKLGHGLDGKAVNEMQYRGMIGSLMYLTASRHDNQFTSCLNAIYQANLKESPLIVIKKIF